MKSTLKMKTLAAAMLVAGGVLGMAPAHAGSNTDTTAPWSVPVSHDFRIVIPGFLYFRVGTDAPASVDMITFTATIANVGNGTPIAGTGGETGGGTAANVVVRANTGQVTVTESNNSGGLGLGTGTVADGYINYDQITTTSSLGTLPAPTLSNAGGNTALPTLGCDVACAGPKTTNRTAVWTYAYANANIPSAGTYGAGPGTGGRVTYTATTP